MRFRDHLVLLTATAVIATGCGARASAADRDGAAGQDGGRRTLVHRGATRSYVVRVPPRPAGDTATLPLVLVLHGGGGNAANAEEMTGFTEKGRREGFVVVYPEGSSRFRRVLLTWNAGHCCGYALERRVDDVGFIDALLDTLIATHRVDPRRVFATGMSNGAMMSHRLGIMLSSRIAGIAPVVGTVFGDEPPARGPVAAIMINGMLDRSVPWEGGTPGGPFADSWDVTVAPPARAQATYWAAANGCSVAATTEERASILTYRHECPAGRGVELHLLRDNGHAWPGGKPGTRRADAPSTAMNATDVIWEFFSRVR